MPLSEPQETGYILLGSNLGNRFRFLAEGISRLQQYFPIEAVSPVYESPDWGNPKSPENAFLNCCVRVRIPSRNSPEHILEILKQIEWELGRIPQGEEKWAPRTIDLDLLLLGKRVYHSEKIQIPHPGVYLRPFALVPLLDVAESPDLRDPISGMPLRWFPGNNRKRLHVTGEIVFLKDEQGTSWNISWVQKSKFRISS